MEHRDSAHAVSRIVEIDENGLETPELLHRMLARELGFPAYYGENLSALSDCLGEVDTPTRIVVTRALPSYRLAWFDRFCTVLEREAGENPFLEFVLARPEQAGIGYDDLLARLEQIDRRLDAIQAQMRPATPAAQPVSRVASETCRNKASGSDGDRFECGSCGCRVSDYLEDTRQLIDGLKYCPQCGREVANPAGSNALGWVGELI